MIDTGWREPPDTSSADHPGNNDSLNSTKVGWEAAANGIVTDSLPDQTGAMFAAAAGEAPDADVADAGRSQSNWARIIAASDADPVSVAWARRFMPLQSTRPRPRVVRATTTRPPTVTTASAPGRKAEAAADDAPQAPPW